MTNNSIDILFTEPLNVLFSVNGLATACIKQFAATVCLRISILMPKRQVPLKTVIAFGAGLLILGFALFLQSLGSGGGEFPLFLMLLGAVCIVASIVLAIGRSLMKRRKLQYPSPR